MPSPIKANGVHYTPPELAGFLAKSMIEHLPNRPGPVQVLDPACGDGGLLEAFANAVPVELRSQLILTGYDSDALAIDKARQRLWAIDADLTLDVRDFLFSETDADRFDAVIANPPYVRTQVLGAEKAQTLARRFELKGRVDLYHAFTKAMAMALKPGAVLGLLTSNRFLTVKSGETIRRFLRTEFALRAIYDLGDIKLFAAAVLPAIVIGTKRSEDSKDSVCHFDRIYQSRNRGEKPLKTYASGLAAVSERSVHGLIAVPEGELIIERGVLSPAGKLEDVFSLSNPKSESWLKSVRKNQAGRFGDVAQVRVGIKTTADAVFVNTDWDGLPEAMRPEAELLHPLLTHREAGRWIPAWPENPKRVLYPHLTSEQGKRVPIRLGDFPKAAAYLESHEARLKGRKYVIESGRNWYEIWVPHQPADWAKPKIVCPDISERPNFFFDSSGAIVQGDCYWITLREGKHADWLFLMLAVANSTFIEKYYDVVFHNKLYAGRRRFITQYVENFPLPELDSDLGQHLVKLARKLVNNPVQNPSENLLDELVWKSFGLRCDER